MTGDDDQRHLEREGDQIPEAASPCVYHLPGGGCGEQQRSRDDDDRGQQREDERVGDPPLGPRGQRLLDVSVKPGDDTVQTIDEVFFLAQPVRLSRIDDEV